MRACITIFAAILIPFLVSAQPCWIGNTIVENYDGANTVFAYDLDGDGDMDVVGIANVGGEVTWWENTDGTGLNLVEHTIATGLNHPADLYVADLDGDNDGDVLVGVIDENNIQWFENVNGDGLTWIDHLIVEGYSRPQGVDIGDMDDDGDNDVLAASAGGEGCSWFENVNGDGLTWEEHLIFSVGLAVYDIYPGDIDNDGDNDVISTGWYGAYPLRWRENVNGDGLIWTEHIITETYSDIACIAIDDIDNDNDLDLVGGAYAGGGLIVLKNEDGIGLTWSEYVIDTDFPIPACVHTEDINSDGYTDVVGASIGDNAIAWWKNTDGLGESWTRYAVVNDFLHTEHVDAADLNDDGFIDIFGAAAVSDEIRWWEHTYNPPATTVTPLNFPVYIPAAGGPFWYSLELSNPTYMIVQGHFHSEIILPNQNVYGPLLNFNLAIGIEQTLTSPILQVDVPAYAPAGAYSFRAVFTPFVVFPPSSDSFEFEKLAAPIANECVHQWSFTNWTGEDTQERSVKAVEVVDAALNAYPNPFNTSTEIRILLPHNSDLTVRVYNVVGQCVVELADGEFAAGNHSFILDASSMASGLYFIRATIPGEVDHVQKVMLVR